MTSIRIAAVVGFGLVLAACQTDFGESIGTILKRDEPEALAAAKTGNPPPAHGPWGPETRARVLGSSADQPQAAAIHDIVKQFQCTAAAVKEIDAHVTAGRLAASPSSMEHRTRRACVVIGLCDTIDGIVSRGVV